MNTYHLQQLIKEEIHNIINEISQDRGESDAEFARRRYPIQNPYGALAHMLIDYQARILQIPKKDRVYGDKRFKKYIQEIFDLLNLGQAPSTEKEAIKILTDKYGPSHFHNGGKWNKIIAQKYNETKEL